MARVDRLREQIRAEIAQILQRRVKDPRVGFASVTDVELSRDLRHAKVFISVLGDDEQKAETVAALGGAAGFIRGQLGAHLRLRHSPELEFRLDTSIERGSRVIRLLKDVAPEERSDERSADDRGGPAAEP